MADAVTIYTDGACSGNPGPGGYGAIIKEGDKTLELSGGENHTTNNRMELIAAITALKKIKRNSKVKIITDSQYLVKAMTVWKYGCIKNRWMNSKKEPVKNKDLWLELIRLSKSHQIEWIWIKGHEGHEENERCDFLAKEAIKKIKNKK